MAQARLIYFEWHPEPLDRGQALKRVANELRRTKVPIANSIVNVMVPSITENFKSRGRPGWKPLAARTVALKGNDRPLVDTGKLMKSVTGIDAWNIDDGEASLTGKPHYGPLHNTGFFNVRYKVNVPARVWAMYHDQDIDNVVEEFVDWMEGVFNREYN